MAINSDSTNLGCPGKEAIKLGGLLVGSKRKVNHCELTTSHMSSSSSGSGERDDWDSSVAGFHETVLCSKPDLAAND
jgi:prophage antirepressor-like protein